MLQEETIIFINGNVFLSLLVNKSKISLTSSYWLLLLYFTKSLWSPLMKKQRMRTESICKRKETTRYSISSTCQRIGKSLYEENHIKLGIYILFLIKETWKQYLEYIHNVKRSLTWNLQYTMILCILTIGEVFIKINKSFNLLI